MNNEKPSYSEAMIAVLTFISDVAKDPRTPEDVVERAGKVAGDFLVAALLSMVGNKESCSTCKGKGTVNVENDLSPGYTESMTCPDCNGGKK